MPPPIAPALARPPRRGATEALAAFVAEGRVGAATVQAATPAVLDTLAVMLAGGVEPAVQTLAASLDGCEARRSVFSFWSPRRYRADDAALLFGMASHVLDYDDVSMLSVCHPSAPVLSALLAAAEWERIRGRDLLEAFAMGTEVMVRLGQAMGFRHYALGFHATATLGTVGAAAACARLARLDTGRSAHAIAIAASLASGLRKNFGTPVKSLHVGIAAANGLKAARLAAAGLEGATEVLDDEGYLFAFSGGQSDRWPDTLQLGHPFVVDDPGFERKRYPCCYMLHKIAEGTLALRRLHGLDLGAVTAVDIDMPPGGTKPLIHPFPTSGFEALFSAPYAATAALANGCLDLSSFTDEAVLRPGLQSRLRDVTVREIDRPPEARDLGRQPVTVTMTLRSGERISQTVTAAPGSARDPLTPDQLRRKWIECVMRSKPTLDGGLAGWLFDRGLDLGEMRSLAPWLTSVATAVGADATCRPRPAEVHT